MIDKNIITWDDIPYDIKELVKFGVYTKEEVVAKFCRYEEENINDDIKDASYATREECETLLKKYENKERRKEESQWKKVRVTFELEADERYYYWDNKATLELYVNKYWSDKKIKDYVKEHMRTSVCKVYDECYW